MSKVDLLLRISQDIIRTMPVHFFNDVHHETQQIEQAYVLLGYHFVQEGFSSAPFRCTGKDIAGRIVF